MASLFPKILNFLNKQMKVIYTLLLGFCFVPVTAEADALSVTEVAPGIYVHFGEHEWPDKNNHGEIANIGFIVGQSCVAVIDSGGNPQQGYALRNAIKQVTALPVCYVINTHVHPDHIYGNRAFSKSGAQFVGHHKLPRAMALRGPFYSERSVEQLGTRLSADDIIPPDLVVQDQMQLDLGGRKLLLTAYPTAHTDSDLTVYDQNTDTLWAADLLFLEHLPVIDGGLKGWLGVIEQLEQQSFSKVIPGHGPLVTNWPQAIQPQKAYLRLLLKEVRAAIKDGIYLEDAVNTVGWSAKNQWQLFDQFHRKNVTTAYAELEWED